MQICGTRSRSFGLRSCSLTDGGLHLSCYKISSWIDSSVLLIARSFKETILVPMRLVYYIKNTRKLLKKPKNGG